ncbi:MAG TPA: GDP-L-fucose synthase [Pyrinomonadaceae bacterium]|nr:GDP-L-fucose synthase [Pyrinomonadaceae bacterium]
MQWSDKTVVVTGGNGFLGSFVVEALHKRGCKNVFVPRSSEFDLRERDDITRLYDQVRPNIVLHLAAVVGGIGANQANPGRFFYDNAIMGIQLIEYARLAGVEKFVALGTICAYPKFSPVPFKEDDLWNGYPEETNAPYGLAKKMMLVQAQSYREQYGFNTIYLLPVNLYGPRDNFDLETSHVIPALIRKFVEANERGSGEVVLWGDGSPTREFLYVEDAAEGVVLATEHYNNALPVNLGTGEEMSIKNLAEMIAAEVGYTGRFIWDTSKPNGQPRRCLDVTRAKELFGFEAVHRLRDGIPKTIAWFMANRESLRQVVYS